MRALGRRKRQQEVFGKLFADSATPAQANFLLGHAYYDGRNLPKRSGPTRQCYRPILPFPALIASWARYISA